MLIKLKRALSSYNETNLKQIQLKPSLKKDQDSVTAVSNEFLSIKKPLKTAKFTD